MKSIHFKQLDSTNKFLKENYTNFENLTYVSTSFQNKGRGREERVWQSSKNKNLLFSILIKDSELISNFRFISVGVAYIICQYIESLGIKGASIKWPNDIFINNKKICGILLESSIPNYLVVGVGLNVNQKRFLYSLHYPATSLSKENKHDYDIDGIKNALFTKLNDFLLNYKKYFSKVERYLNRKNYLLNKEIEVNGIIGTVIGIDKNNNLLVKEKRGIISISSGEVFIKKS